MNTKPAKKLSPLEVDIVRQVKKKIETVNVSSAIDDAVDEKIDKLVEAVVSKNVEIQTLLRKKIEQGVKANLDTLVKNFLRDIRLEWS